MTTSMEYAWAYSQNEYVNIRILRLAKIQEFLRILNSRVKNSHSLGLLFKPQDQCRHPQL